MAKKYIVNDITETCDNRCVLDLAARTEAAQTVTALPVVLRLALTVKGKADPG